MHRNEKGMSLVEIMVAMGLVGGLALALSQITVHSMKSARNVTLATDWNNLLSLIRLIFNNEAACKEALSGLTFNPGGMLDVQQLKLGGSVVAQKGQPPAGLRVDSMELRNSGAPSTDLIVGTETWKRYIGELEVKATKMGEVAGSKNYDEKLRLSVVVNAANQIQRCYGEYSSAQTCADLGGNYDDTQTPKCKVPGILQNCQLYPSSGGGPSTDDGGCNVSVAQIQCPVGKKLITGGCACQGGGVRLRTCTGNYTTNTYFGVCSQGCSSPAPSFPPNVQAYCCDQ